MCIPCVEQLSKYQAFRNNCFETEEKIRTYILKNDNSNFDIVPDVEIDSDTENEPIVEDKEEKAQTDPLKVENEIDIEEHNVLETEEHTAYGPDDNNVGDINSDVESDDTYVPSSGPDDFDDTPFDPEDQPNPKRRRMQRRSRKEGEDDVLEGEDAGPSSKGLAQV